jgi:type VI secretion system secreted protein VgrG
MPISLTNRTLQLSTPFGEAVLLPERVRITERLSQPFVWTLELASETGDLNVDEILGYDITLSFELPSGGGTRYFNGFVTEFAQTGYRERLHEYRATVRPWLWFLTRTADCRVFQQKSVVDIFKEVAKKNGFSDYSLKLSGQYEPRTYCVQYRETDFNFLSRLLEQEGIHYFFEHSSGKHEMILCDDSTRLGTKSGYERVPFFAPSAQLGQQERDHFNRWTLTRSVQAAGYVTTDYDFEMPQTSLEGKSTIKRDHGRASFQMFDYPAGISGPSPTVSEDVAKIRLEELQSAFLVARGSGNAAGLGPGQRFELAQHPRRDMNTNYLVTAATYTLDAVALTGGEGDDSDSEFAVEIEAIDAKTRFRPPRLTPKPIVQGAQSALVVGQSGDEIVTDKYGRVKVQFFWDRYGKKDENSSCWIRVAQVWAGDGWGGLHIPRVGQEVLVSFLEGDPDRPIITGRVYNATSMPPYQLPDDSTQSGIKSRSSKGGTRDNFNEIRFEDKKGSELLYAQAEKDLTVLVKNDRSVEVRHDESVTVKNDRTDSVGNDETATVGKDRDTTIKNDEKHTVQQNRTTSVGADDKLKVTQDGNTDIGQSFTLTAGTQITLQTGAAKLVMKSDGTIELQGVTVKIEGSQSIAEKAGQSIEMSATQVKATGTSVEVNGTKTAIEGAIIDVNASGIASLKGALTKIG